MDFFLLNLGNIGVNEKKCQMKNSTFLVFVPFFFKMWLVTVIFCKKVTNHWMFSGTHVTLHSSWSLVEHHVFAFLLLWQTAYFLIIWGLGFTVMITVVSGEILPWQSVTQ